MNAETRILIELEKSAILGRHEREEDNVSTEYFIENYCEIESKAEVGAPVISFSMWPAQRTALKDIEKSKKTIVLKARQLGLTWLILCYIVHHALKFPGYRAIMLSETEEKTKELIKRVDFILRHLPSWLIISEDEKKKYERENGKGSYKGLSFFSGVLYVQIRGQGEISEIKGQPATDGAGAGLTADIVFFDEWALHRYAQEIFTAAFPTINRPGSGKFIGISTNRRGSYFERVWENALKQGFCKIFLPWHSDPARDEDWYEDTKSTLGSGMFSEYPATAEEALMAGDNVAFPEFSESIHVEPALKNIPERWTRWAAVDNGYNDPYFWLKFAVDEDGIVHVYYEQTRWRAEPQMSYSEQARVFSDSLLHLSENNNFTEEKLDYIVAGQDAWHTRKENSTGKSILDIYRDSGLERQGFRMAHTNRRDRKMILHEYLKPLKKSDEIDEITGQPKYYAKLQISEDCPYLIECIKRLVNDERDPEKVKDMSDFDNGFDCLTYGIISRHRERSDGDEPQKDNFITEHKKRLAGKFGGRLYRKRNWR